MWYLKISEATPDCHHGGPDSSFPMLYVASKEELKRFKALIAECEIKGLNPFLRGIVWTGFRDSPSYKDIIETIPEMEEISEEVYQVVTKIPHLAPIQSGIRQLQEYLEVYNHEASKETSN